MKIHQIISNVFSKKNQNKQKNNNNIDTISFGQKNSENQTNVISKKASMALLSNSIASISFKGREVIDRKIYVGTSGISSHSIGDSQIASHADEKVERTSKEMVTSDAYGYTNGYNVRKDHARVDIYYADEGEYITDEMRGKYHYIVKKEEPFLNLSHIKDNYKRGYQNFANEAVREVVYFENLENSAKKSLGVNQYFINENEEKYNKAKEEQERLRKAKTNHVWEESKYDKQLEEADYYADQNRQKLEDAKNKRALYASQSQRAQEKLPNAVKKYSLLKELDDKGGEKQELTQKNIQNEYEKTSLEHEIRKLQSKKENIEAEKKVFDAQISYAQVNIKNLKEEYDGYYSQKEIKEYEAQIVSTKSKIEKKDDEVNKIEQEKQQKEKQLAEVKRKQKEFYLRFEKIDAELDKIMERVENFYKENYPEQLW